MADKTNIARLQRNRRLWGGTGFLTGFFLGVLINHQVYGIYINFLPFSVGCLSAVLFLLFAEKKKQVVRSEDLKKLQIEANLKPFNLISPDPIKGKREIKD